MSTIVLSPGPIHTLVQNTIYALPASRCLLYADAGTFEESSDGTNFTALTLTNNQVELAGIFLRCTSGASDVRLAKF